MSVTLMWLLVLAGADPMPVAMPPISPEVRALIAGSGATVDPKVEAAILKLADQGDVSAAALAGEILLFPTRPGGPDPVRACAYSENAAAFASATHNLATCYFRGDGRSKDLVKARSLYERASQMGMSKAKCALGNMLVKGEGGPVDKPRGVALCKAAADAGIADAQVDYAQHLLRGEGAARDPITARTYLTKAVASRHRNAMFTLAQVYFNGDGVARDVPQAATLWIDSYQLGRRDAAFHIGLAAMSVLVDAAKAKQPVPDTIIGQARKWLGVATIEDPDSARRARAAELLGHLDALVGSEG